MGNAYKVKIVNVSIDYENDVAVNVRVYFNSTDNLQTDISGNIPLDYSEYVGNENLEDLEVIVKQKILYKLSL